jgi:hypothetical protein
MGTAGVGPSGWKISIDWGGVKSMLLGREAALGVVQMFKSRGFSQLLNE